MGMKFGMEEGTFGPVPSSVPNFTPSVQRQGCRTPKTEIFLLRFNQNVEYKRPAGAYPLREFNKINITRLKQFHKESVYDKIQ